MVVGDALNSAAKRTDGHSWATKASATSLHAEYRTPSKSRVNEMSSPRDTPYRPTAGTPTRPQQSE